MRIEKEIFFKNGTKIFEMLSWDKKIIKSNKNVLNANLIFFILYSFTQIHLINSNYDIL